VRKAIISLGLSPIFSINKSEMTITCQLNGSQILFKGLDDTEKIKSVTPEVGVITDIWVEEATETHEDDIRQLEKRLRGESEHPKRLILSFNPILKNHWIFKRYFSGFYDSDRLLKTEKLLILKTTYKDNKFLTQDDIDRLENETDKYWYDVYTLGNWGVLGSIIFTNWKVADLSNETGFDNIRNGLDFGYGPDPAAFTRMHYDATRSRLYILAEVNGHELTNQDLADLLRPIIGRGRVVCDSAEPKSIRELQINGISAVPAEKGPDSVNFGIQWLKRQEIIIDRRCQNTINEFQTYQWKKTRSGEVLPIPSDRDNHHIDSARYALQDCMLGASKIGFQSTGKRRMF
jgi:phage terminase large subunit